MAELNYNYSKNSAERAKGSSIKPLRQALPFLKPYYARLVLAFICLTIAAAASVNTAGVQL